MNEYSQLALRTSDLAEAVHAVSRVYCPHEVQLKGSNRGLISELEVRGGGAIQLVNLKYSTPVRIDAGKFENLLLMMSCVEGSAVAAQARSVAEWHKGQTLPLSPNLVSQLDFDRAFTQSSVRLDIEGLERSCARRLNHPLEQPLRFALHPFSTELESAWRKAVNLALGYEAAGIELPAAARRSFDDFMLSLVLEMHPHNYSQELQEPRALAAPRVVRQAERMMQEAEPDATVSDIAAALGISVRSLEAGFREWKQETPTRFLRRIRLDAARKALSHPDVSTSVTDVALRLGFLHLPRFSQYYREEFSEYPSQTLRRSRVGR